MEAMAILARFWREIIIALLAIMLAVLVVIDGHRLKSCHASVLAEQKAHAADIASWKQATADAQKADQEHAASVVAQQNKVSEDAQHDLQDQLADARARASDYANRLRAASANHSGGGNGASVPATANPAGSIASASGTAVILEDDLRVCAENTVKAQGWREWWQGQAAIQR